MKTGIITVLIAVLFVGCDDFGNINSDPNNPSTAKTELLLTKVQTGMAPGETGISDIIGSVTGTLYVQYFAETQYPEASQYETINFNFNPWYQQPLQDLQTIIDLNSNEETASEVISGGSNANQIAVARILQTYFYHMMTDRWGMIPYSEALQGRDNLQPAYDSQADIYEGMITELKEAVNQMDGGTGVTGDILFGGDMDQWARFANTLRLRLALRMSEANSSLAQSEFADAAGSDLIEGDIMYPFLGDANNENPWFSRFRTRTDYAISKFMADTMKSLDDMRLTAYADPAPDAENSTPGVQLEEIQGMPYGIADPGSITNSAVSFPGSPAVRGQDAGLPIMTMAEVNFALAEGAQRGWISGTASDYYEAGIEASWEQWGVFDQADYDAYVNDSAVAYDANNWDQLIGYQKWIALFPQGYESWSEWRRLGYPQLTPAPAALNNSGEIPVRHAYPTTESELNRANYEAAVSAQGQDGLDTNVWWDQ